MSEAVAKHVSALQVPFVGEVSLLTFEEIMFHWPDIRVALAETPEIYEYYTDDYLFEKLRDNHMQMWAVVEEEVIVFLMLTQILVFPRARILQIVWGFGEGMNRYFGHLEGIVQRFAAVHGCKRIEIVGREGWVRRTRKLPGVRFEAVVVSYPVQAQKGN